MKLLGILVLTALSTMANGQDAGVQSIQIGEAREEKPFVPGPSPLEAKISLKVIKAPLADFFSEISRQSKLKFNFVGGVETCSVSALLQDVTVREALQVALEARLTYQQLGRSDTYTITPPMDKRSCPRIDVRKPATGRCESGDGPPISITCKNGSLLSFAELLFSQTKASFMFTDGAEDISIDGSLRKANLEKAIKKIDRAKGVQVKQWPGATRFVVKAEDA